MASQSQLDLYRRLPGPDIDTYVARRRDDGASWRTIAVECHAIYGRSVHAKTLARWFAPAEEQAAS